MYAEIFNTLLDSAKEMRAKNVKLSVSVYRE